MSWTPPEAEEWSPPEAQGWTPPEAKPDPEDTQDLTTLGMLGQEAKAFNKTIMGGLDFLSAPLRVGARMAGAEHFSFEQALQDLQGMATGDTREDFVPEGLPRDVANAIGTAEGLATGFIPVTRTAGARSVLEEFLGFGMTEMDDAARLAQTTGKALKASDDFVLNTPHPKAFVDPDGSNKPISRWDKYTQPLADTVRKYVDTRVGGRFEKAAETATRAEATLPSTILKDMDDVLEVVGKDREIKRQFLDLHINGKVSSLERMSVIRNMIRNRLGSDGVKKFDTFMARTQKFNDRISKALYVDDPKIKDDVYFHSEKITAGKKDTTLASIPEARNGSAGVPSALKARKRKPGAKMSDAEIDEYMNPLLAHVKYIADMEHLVQLSKEFHVPPSLKTGAAVEKYFKGLEKALRQQGLDKERAAAGAKLMNQHFVGMRTSPSATVRSLMSLGYAGTLAQVKTSVLNLADAFVSMAAQGVRPTLKGMMTHTKGEFGKNLNELGLDNAQNVGEFVRNFDKYIDNPTRMQQFARVSHKISDASMAVSGFKFMDRVGKGVVLRSAMNQARSAAKKGNLVKSFGDVMTPGELKKLQPYLAKGAKVKDMPADVAQLAEQLAFTSLGKQQLISTVGRPLAYLNNSTIRPAYALTGFAIKQFALLRKNIIGEMKAGRPAKAAEFAAKYVAFAALGTSFVNESREALFQNQEFYPEDVLIGTLEHIASVVTMNKLGSPYALSQFRGDPVGYVTESLLPPLGLVSALGQDAAALIFGGEYNAELVKRFPLLGDFYKHYWSSKTPEQKGSAMEEYQKLLERD